jgi:hypothetical protein
MEKPRLLRFPKHGAEETGFLVPFEDLPFPIAHVYCIGPVPENEIRGNHAKRKNNQVLVAIGGSADIWLESPSGEEYHFQLNDNREGLFVPKGYWRKAQLHAGCYLLGLHSMAYDPSDYVSDYEEFKKLRNDA